MSTASSAIPKQTETAQLEFISRLFAELADKVYYKNTSAEYLWANPAHLKNLNVNSISEIYGKQDRDFFPEASLKTILDNERSVIDTGKPIIDTTLLTPSSSGGKTWTCSTIVPIYNHEKNIVGLLSISNELPTKPVTPVSEKELINNLLNDSQDIIYFKDLDSKFIRASQAHAQKFGVNHPDELIGKSEFDYLCETQARSTYKIEQEVILSGQPLLGKIDKVVLGNGDINWIQRSVSPLKNHAGDIIGTFGSSKDITAQKEAESELETISQQLLALSKQADMNEVANNILHNVGNVLNSVNIAASTATTIVKSLKIQSIEKTADLLDNNINTSNFLSQDEKGKQIPKFLHQLAGKLNSDQETAISELNALTDYINHIKEVLNMQQTNFKHTDISEKIKLSRLIEKSVDINRGSLTRHEIKVSIDVINNPEILIDKHKSLQVLINLIRNAKQACDDSNQREKRVNITANNYDEHSFYIDVADNGIGISDDNLKKIFEHGFTTKQDGNGFGLHSCQNLVKELGGTLTAHSDGLGEGTTFTLVLPKEPSEENQILS